MKLISALCGLTILLCSSAHAAPPDLKTPSPVIFLADNLDESQQLGWCIDTVGRGLSDRLHAHSCKPQGGDVQFRFDTETGQIQSVAFDTLCARYAGTLPLGLIPCDDTTEQAFVHDQDSGTLRPKGDQQACLVVGDSSRPAGPFMSRTLEVVRCDAVEEGRKTWIIRP